MKYRHLLLVLTLLLILALPAAVVFAESTVAGDLDFSFSENGKVIASTNGIREAADLAVQPDGKILILSTTGGTEYDIILLRYNPDGSLDPSFSGDGRLMSDFGTPQNGGVKILLQPDGKVLVVGWGQTPSNQTVITLSRYLPNGNLDTSFADDGKDTTSRGNRLVPEAAALMPNGQFLVAGQIFLPATVQPYNVGHFIARYNANGSLDTTYGDNGIATYLFYESGGEAEWFYNNMVVTADGSIVAVGGADNPDHGWWVIDLYNPDGSHNRTIEGPEEAPKCYGIVICRNHAYGIEMQPDGKLVIAGSYSTLSGEFEDVESQMFHLMRLNADFSLDTDFGEGGHVSTVITNFPEKWLIEDAAYDVALQADGRIVAVGYTPGSNGEADFALARYLPSGDPDISFGFDGIITTSFGSREHATVVAIAPPGNPHAGKIVAAGAKDNGLPIARYYASDNPGQVDTAPIYMPLILHH